LWYYFNTMKECCKFTNLCFVSMRAGSTWVIIGILLILNMLLRKPD
jgi:hypothetical protein